VANRRNATGNIPQGKLVCFQSFNLIDELNVYENVELPANLPEDESK